VKKVIDKYNEFAEFYANCKEIFKFVIEKDETHSDFQKFYSFYISPGSRMGHVDKRVIEIFYGNRPFDTKKTFEFPNVRKEILTEHGATLTYSQLDNGTVLITLYPAGTENFKVSEDFIILDFLNNTTKLKSTNEIKRHWNYFIAYMHVTCLEGTPHFIHKFRVWKLRTFHQIAENKIVHKSKFNQALGSTIKTIFTVGLSGFILFFFSQLISNKENTHIVSHLYSISEKQTKIINILNKNDTNSHFYNLSKNLLLINDNLNIIKSNIIYQKKKNSLYTDTVIS